MSFVYPNFLWAYTLIAVPIVIHLFNFRRYKTVYFSRVASLREVQQDSKTGNQLKHLLVLLARILTIFFLVTAFAQPFIPTGESSKTENVTSIYLDNTFSMQAKGKDGDLLNECKNKAIELVKSLDINEKVNVLTADLLGKHQRFYSKTEAIDLIKEVSFSPLSTSLTNVLSNQIDLLKSSSDNSNERIILFSDFQESTSELDGWKREAINCSYYQAEAQLSENIYIDSVWFSSPVHRVGQPKTLNFKIVNKSEKDEEDLTVNLTINNKKQGPKRVNIKANSYSIDQIEYMDQELGKKQGKLEVSTNQLFFDDEFFFTYDIKAEISILIVNGSESDKNLEQLYALDDYYKATIKPVESLNSEDFKSKELVIFHNVNSINSGIQELNSQLLRDGGSIVFIPGKNSDLDNWNKMLGQLNLPKMNGKDSINKSLDYFNFKDPLYEGVFEKDPSNYKFPKVFAAYPFISNSSHDYTTLFGYGESKKTPFFIYSQRENGKVYVLNSSLKTDQTNFQNHALFAATFLRIAETATFRQPLYGTLGNIPNFPIYEEIEEKHIIHLLNKELEIDVIPLLVNQQNNRAISFSHLEDEIYASGFYELKNEKGFEKQIGLNYNRQESDIECLSSDQIESMFESSGWTINALKTNDSNSLALNQLKAREYWRILLILGLIFIAVEIALLKFWKS